NIPFLSDESTPDSAPPDTGIQPITLPLTIGNIQLRDVYLYYNDRSIPLDGSLHKLKILVAHEDADTYRFRLNADSGGVNYHDKPVPLTQFRMSGSWQPEITRIDTMLFAVPGLQFKGNLSAAIGASPSTLSGDVRLFGNPQPLFSQFKDMFAPDSLYSQGSLDVLVNLAGTVDNPGLTMQIDLPTMQWADIDLRQGYLRAQWQNDQLTLEKLQMQLLSGTVTGNGYLAMDSLFNHRLNLDVKELALRRTLGIVLGETPIYQGVINGQIKSSGPLQKPDDLQTKASLAFQKVQYSPTNSSANNSPRRVEDFFAEVTYQAGKARLSFIQGGTAINANLHYQAQRLDGNFSLHISHIAPLAALVNITGTKGTASARGTVNGQLDSLRVAVEFSGNDFLYQNFPIDSVNGSVS
ncbi:MAG: hypothetical protein GWO08_02565, partial [Gammaproteobacteria bacterium]|nr:hypothetical protein [Gammaproteobacteria bacterium]NIW44792.1 hypothetical protein [Gammaproteobacteria bacterium]NIX02021.1 hypothetical protein [Phycisphaerae bacterium]